MAQDINKVVMVGRLTRDSELKYTTSGMAVGHASIAVNGRKGKDGNESVSFFDVNIFGKLAENLQQYLTKGKQIGITGYLKQERWQGQDGTNRTRITVNAEEVELLGGRSNDNLGGQDYNGASEAFQEDIEF